MKNHLISRKLRLESLEERALLAVTAGFEETAAELAAPTSAASWVVNTADDPADWDSADDILSLREAIDRAADGDKIVFDSSLTGGTITLNGGQLEISKCITIDASEIGGIAINASEENGPFILSAGTEKKPVELIGLTLTGGAGGVTNDGIGHLVSCIITENGSTGVYNSGILELTHCDILHNGEFGIYNTGTLTASDVTIVGHRARDGWGGGGICNEGGHVSLTACTISENSALVLAGGIWNWSGGTMTLEDCVVSGNSAQNVGGGGIYNGWGGSACTMTLINCTVAENNSGSQGGGIVNSDGCNITIEGSSISENTARGGAGVLNAGGTAELTGCTVTNNISIGDLGFGGGILNTGTMTVTDSVVSGNSADAANYGGGGVMNTNSLTLTNTVIAGNSTNLEGGGLYNLTGTYPSGGVILYNCTVAGNSADNGGDGIKNEGTAYCYNSIVAQNGESDIDCAPRYQAEGTIYAYNTLSSYIDWTESENSPVYDPTLPLFNDFENGDFSLAAVSQAINIGNNDYVSIENDLAGTLRIIDEIVDLGAYEYRQGAISIVVTTLEDTVDAHDGQISLREAVELYAKDGDTVTFAPDLAGGTIFLGGNNIGINKGITVDATSIGCITIDANKQSHVLSIGGGTEESPVKLICLTVTGGIAGGIRTAGKLSITNCTIAGNTSNSGGAGICNYGDLTLSDSMVVGNAVFGWWCGGIMNGGTMLIENSTIKGNIGDAEGGGISNNGDSLTMINTVIDGNLGLTSAGVECLSGTTTLINCTIKGNNSYGGMGGGVVNWGSELSMINCAVYGNHSYYTGGGIYSYGGSDSSLINCTITGNTADQNGGGVSGPMNLTNSIVALNKAGYSNSDDVSSYYSGSPIPSYSIIGTDPGFTTAPVFEFGYLKNLNDLDLSFSTVRWAVDRGDNRVVTTETDIVGNPRIYAILKKEGVVDIGAYEFQGPAGEDVEAPSLTVTTSSDVFDPTDHLTSLREAIFYAADGDTVTFDSSLRGETIVLNGSELLIEKSITVDASCIGGITINADSESRVFCVDGQTADTRIELIGLTITGGYASNGLGGGIYNGLGTLTLANCVVAGNTANDYQYYGYDGIYNSGTLITRNSTIISNGVMSDYDTADAAIFFYNSIVLDSIYDVYGSIYAYNTLSDNDWYWTDSSDCLIYDYSEPLFVDMANGDYHLAEGSQAIDIGDNVYVTAKTDLAGNSRIYNRIVDLGAYEYLPDIPIPEIPSTVVTTLEDVTDMYDGQISLREAITYGYYITFADALAGGTIILREGELSVDGGVVIDASDIGGITIDAYGESRALYVEGQGIELIGLTITNGFSDFGGGIFIFSSQDDWSEVRLVDCAVINNTATTSGGGICIVNSCEIGMEGCIISSNTADIYGGGICYLISSENGYYTYARLGLVCCTITDNSASSGGGVYISGRNESCNNRIALRNCVVARNAASYFGGGIYVDGSVYLTNCTVTQNAAECIGGGVVTYGNGQKGFYNSIVLGNEDCGTAPDIYRLEYSSGSIYGYNTLSSFTRWTGSENCLNYEFSRPLFVDAANGDYTLANGSQAVNVGDNSYVYYLDETDLAGNPRIVGGIVDLGAYEFQGPVVTTLDDVVDDSDGLISLREAVTVYAEEGYTVTFAQELAGGTIVLAGSEIEINKGMTIDASSIGGITVDGNGESGVFYISAWDSPVQLVNLTITGGDSDYGGGILNGGVLTLANCAIVGNTAAYEGGGINNYGNLTLTNCTISGNSANYSGGGIYSEYYDFALSNSIVAVNYAGEYGDDFYGYYDTSEITGINIIGADPGFKEAPIFRAGKLVNSDTLDLSLTETSTAINVGDNSVVTTKSDVVGNPRIVGYVVDLGAYEYQKDVSSTVVTILDDIVDESDGFISLREAIEIYSKDGDTITFDSRLAGGTILLNGTQLFIDKGIAIDASGIGGITIDGNGESGILRVDGDIDVKLTGLTLTHGNNTVPGYGGGAICNCSAGVLSLVNCSVTGNTAPFGGGISNLTGGTITLTDCDISGNSSENTLGGGGIFNWSGNLSLLNCAITGNSAQQGGGIANNGGDVSNTLTLTNSTISDNSATMSGGGISNGGTMTLTTCSVTGNSVTGEIGGGGIINTGSMKLINSVISGNYAHTYYYGGGGILSSSDQLSSLINCTVSGNSSYGNGDGIYIAGGSLELVNTIVALNEGNDDIGYFNSGYDFGHNNIVGIDPGFKESPVFESGKLINFDTLDLSLTPGSIAIDRGDNSTVTTKTDVAGNQRIVASWLPEAVVDIGAYEYQEKTEVESIVVTIAADIVDETDNLTSLREAILFAESGDVITFDASLAGETITLECGELVIGKAITIDASGIGGMTVDGNGESSVFHVSSEEGIGLSVGLVGLTVTGGDGDYGGGIYNDCSALMLINCVVSHNTAYNGGGIYNDHGTLTLVNSEVSENSADSGGGVYNNGIVSLIDCTVFGNNGYSYGGGVYNDRYSSLTLEDCTVAGNFCNFSSGFGGGVFSRGTLVLSHCEVTRNEAFSGAGVCYWNGTGNVTLTDCRISENNACMGGGLRFLDETYSADPETAITLTNCVISGNVADDYGVGAGIDNIGCILTMTNCEVSGNSSIGDYYGLGGGITNQWGAVTLTNCTVSGNSAKQGGGIDNYGDLTLINSIVAFNYADTCEDISYGENTVTGHNNIIGADPGFKEAPIFVSGELVNFDTLDLSLVETSTAINVGDNRAVTEEFDVAGNPRIVGGVVDLGAYEYQRDAISTVVTTLDDVVDESDGFISLREAVMIYAEEGATVTFAPNLAGGTIVLTEGEISIDKGITIDASEIGGITIDGNRQSAILWVNGDIQVDLDSLTLTHGNNAIDGYGGGAICNLGAAMTLTNCSVTENTAWCGGGIAFFYGASMTLVDCVVSGNRSEGPSVGGGGISNYSGNALNLTNCIISDNYAGGLWGGGGIYSSGDASVTLTNCTITGNSANSYGGAIVHSYGTMTLTDCVISGNSSYGRDYGTSIGAIYNSGTMSLTNCIVTGNTALNGSYYGAGGILNGGTLTLTNSTVSGNTTDGVGRYGNADGIHNGGTANFYNSIIAQNGISDISRYTGGSYGTIYAYNTLSSFTEWDESADCLEYDPALPLFADPENGDYTLTADSQAINVGNNNFLTTYTDLAGNSRVCGGVVDLGAYEYQESSPARTIVVTTAEDVVDDTDGFISLREAIQTAAFSDRIVFDESLTGQTILLNGTELEIVKGITIDASEIGGITIDAGGESRVLFVNGGSVITPVELVGLTITGGNLSDEEYGGAGMLCYGTLLMTSCTVVDNDLSGYNSRGGGICNFAALTMTDCVVSGNSVDESEYGGGGIFNSGDLTMTNCCIANNRAADSYGGGIYNSYGTLTLINCTVTGNTTNWGGGGVYNGYYSGDAVAEFYNTVIVQNYYYDAYYGDYEDDDVYKNGSTLRAYNTLSSYNDWDVSSDCLTFDPSAPVYVDADGHVYWSQAIDAGDNAYIAGYETDLAGNPRIMNGTVDIGAYEFNGDAVEFSAPVILTGHIGIDVSYGANRHQLTWTAVDYADFYEIEYSIDGYDWTGFCTADDCQSAVISGLPYGADVTYRVRAVMGDLILVSEWSAEKTFNVCPMDINGDGEISLGDLAILSSCWLAGEGDENFIAAADIDGDGDITAGDRAFLAANWLMESGEADLQYPNALATEAVFAAYTSGDLDIDLDLF